MLSRTMNQIAQSPWARLMWAGIAVLALIQVVAFYRLCASQVARANAREAMLVEQRNAQTARDLPRMRSQAVMSSAVPVSYVFQ